MKRTLLIHHHIFKNAGTSLQYTLKQNFKQQYYDCELPRSQMVTAEDLAQFIIDHPQALAISGHHICLPTPQGEDYRTRSIILLRKPLARVSSIYKFEHKQQANTEGAIKAKELNFKDYVRWRLDKTPTMLCNYQTYYCSRYELKQTNRIPTAENLAIAIQNLQDAAVVGTVEQYDETIALANQVLVKDFPQISLEYTYLNVTGKKQVPTDTDVRQKLVTALGEEMVQELEERNQLDAQLWDTAYQLLSHQMEQQVIEMH